MSQQPSSERCPCQISSSGNTYMQHTPDCPNVYAEAPAQTEPAEFEELLGTCKAKAEPAVTQTAEQFCATYVKTLDPAIAEYLIRTTGPIVFRFAEAFAAHELAAARTERDEVKQQVEQLCGDIKAVQKDYSNVINLLRQLERDECLAPSPALEKRLRALLGTEREPGESK